MWPGNEGALLINKARNSLHAMTVQLADLRRAPLAREAGLVLIWRVLLVILSMGSGFLIARALGPQGYGVYAYALSWIALLGLLVTTGFPLVVMREIGAAEVNGRWGEVRGLLLWSALWIFVSGLLVSGAATLGLSWIPGVTPERHWAIHLVLPLLVLNGWIALSTKVLQGIKRVPRAYFPVQQSLFLILAAVLFVLGVLHVKEALLAQVITSGASLGLYAFWVTKYLPNQVFQIQPQFRVSTWLASALPLFVVDALFTLNNQIDILMLGAFRSSAEVGLYRLANRLATFVGFFLVVANAVIAPRIVAYHACGDYKSLARFIRRIIRFAFFGASFLVVVYILAGRSMLGLAGMAFRSAYPTLLLMSLGQLVNVGAGSVGWILAMTRNERDLIVGVGASVVVNIGLNLVFTPRYGYFGTAIATSLSIIIWNIILSSFVWFRFKIRVSVF